jgi:hypothetical protein
MCPDSCAKRLGITTLELFERSYRKYCGLATSAGGSSAADFAWWRKWGTIPLYVKRFLKDEERKQNAPVLNG